MEDYGYDIQAVADSRAVEQLMFELCGRVQFVFLFCEIEPPYAVTPVVPMGSMRELGALRWRRAVETGGFGGET